MRMNIVMALLLVGAALAVLPTVNAQTAETAMQSTCAPPYPLVASANNGAGYINFCVYYPHTVMPGASFNVFSVLTAPTTVLPVFQAAGAAFAASIGCTEGTPVNVLPATNGVVGTMITHQSSFTMTGEQCLGSASGSLTIAALPLNIYLTSIPISILTENVRLDTFNYLCDAPAIAPNAYSTTATTCNDPNLALSGELDICPESTPCFIDIADDTTADGFLSVPPATISNISVNGTFPSELTVHADFPGDGDNLGLDAWTTAWFWIAAVLFFSYMGWLVALAFAIPGLLASMVPSIKTLLEGLGLDFEALFILCLLGFILELAANRFQWGGYTSGTRRLRIIGV